jgi:hypothetical protein
MNKDGKNASYIFSTGAIFLLNNTCESILYLSQNHSDTCEMNFLLFKQKLGLHLFFQTNEKASPHIPERH